MSARAGDLHPFEAEGSRTTCIVSEDTICVQVVSRLWQYIKEHNLQDPAKKKNIIPDEKMLTIFTAPLDQFSMNKQLSKHILPKGKVLGSLQPASGQTQSGRQPGLEEHAQPLDLFLIAQALVLGHCKLLVMSKRVSGVGGGGGGVQQEQAFFILWSGAVALTESFGETL